MKEGTIGMRCILVAVVISLFAGIVSADTTFSTSGVISISTSTSVVGTVNETVSLTKTNIGGSPEKLEFSNTQKSVNPSGLKWQSHLSVNSNEKASWVDYSRIGGLPAISWRQFFRA